MRIPKAGEELRDLEEKLCHSLEKRDLPPWPKPGRDVGRAKMVIIIRVRRDPH
jgi:hypothetical protein